MHGHIKQKFDPHFHRMWQVPASCSLLWHIPRLDSAAPQLFLLHYAFSPANMYSSQQLQLAHCEEASHLVLIHFYAGALPGHDWQTAGTPYLPLQFSYVIEMDGFLKIRNRIAKAVFKNMHTTVYSFKPYWDDSICKPVIYHQFLLILILFNM